VLIFGEIARLGLGGAMRYVYALVFAHILTGHILRREWERVVFFASPMVLVNATDAFNRFMLCLVCAQLIDWGLRHRRLLVAACAAVVFATTHPFNAAFILAAAAPILSPMLIAFVAVGAELSQFDALLGPLFSDKRALLHTFGDKLPYLSSGSYAINPALRNIAFGLPWWLAVVLPGLGAAAPTLVGLGAAAFNAIWLGAIVFLTPHRRNLLLILVPMSVLVSMWIGNSAVGYRHLLPMLYAGLMIFGRSPPAAGRGFAFGLVRLGFGPPQAPTRGAAPR
jgi:hypothetical protein